LEINHLAVLTAALSSLVLGGLWYSPLLFYKAWRNANGFTDEELKQKSSPLPFVLAFGFGVVMSYNLAFFLAGPSTDAVWGLAAGARAGLGWAAMLVATIAVFERRSWAYILINGGYCVVYLSAAGLIIGAWR
jgi:hypothetical protein